MSNANESVLLYASQILKATDPFTRPKFELTQFCFDKQLEFILDKRRFKTAVCSRRAGKTVGAAAHLTWAALSKERVVCLYITLSRSNGKKLIWPELLEINETYGLGGKVNESELSIKYPNGSIVYISGAKDKKEIEKFRGLAIYLCYIDESQSFPQYIEELVDSVISKALFDHNGTLCLTGTPGPVPVGYFHDCSHNAAWGNFSWTMYDNPYLPIKAGRSVDELVQEEMDRKGVTIDDPVIQRECFARWTTDLNALVFRYDKHKNHYTELPESHAPWRYIVGVDIGYDDADAIAVIGYNEKFKACYLVHERVQAGQGITELARQIIDIYNRYKPDKIVMDTAGLGKKVAEEITRRYQIMIEPADKSRKFEFIELFNDAMRTSMFFADNNSRFAQDCLLVEWDRDAKTSSEKPKISDSFHSDICDAVVYAFKESYHWLYKPSAPIITPGSKQWFEKQEREMEKAAMNCMLEPDELDPGSKGYL